MTAGSEHRREGRQGPRKHATHQACRPRTPPVAAAEDKAERAAAEGRSQAAEAAGDWHAARATYQAQRRSKACRGEALYGRRRRRSSQRLRPPRRRIAQKAARQPGPHEDRRDVPLRRHDLSTGATSSARRTSTSAARARSATAKGDRDEEDRAVQPASSGSPSATASSTNSEGGVGSVVERVRILRNDEVSERALHRAARLRRAAAAYTRVLAVDHLGRGSARRWSPAGQDQCCGRARPLADRHDARVDARYSRTCARAVR